jgi:hypothetical protein
LSRRHLIDLHPFVDGGGCFRVRVRSALFLHI